MVGGFFGGAGIGVTSLVFVSLTDKTSPYSLFSGQDQLGPLIHGAAGWTIGALILLMVCKS